MQNNINTDLMPLVSLRHRMGYTQEELASKINKDRATIAAWEKDASGVSISDGKALSGLLKYPLESIFFGRLLDYIEKLTSQ